MAGETEVAQELEAAADDMENGLVGVQYAARAMPTLALRRYHIQLAFEDASLGG